MTPEEAIKYIIQHCNPDYPKGKTEWETAMNMAIEALKAQLSNTSEIPNSSDQISRQAAIELVNSLKDNLPDDERIADIVMAHNEGILEYQTKLSLLPSAQTDGIPLEWINKHLEWLDNCDNDFSQLAKVSIRAMVELWKKDRI